MNPNEKKPGFDKDQQPSHKQQGDDQQHRQQQGGHPSDKSKTHDTPREHEGDKGRQQQPPGNPGGGPTGGHRDQQR